MHRPVLCLLILAAAAGCSGAGPRAAGPEPESTAAARLDLILAVDSIAADRAVVSLIGAPAGAIALTVSPASGAAVVHQAASDMASGRPLQWPVEGLEAGARYVVDWRFEARDGRTAAGRRSFRTAPPAAEAAAVRFAFGADLGGQNVCRDREHGYAIFAAIAARRPDFFVALGDMIYADDVCEPRGQYGNPQVAHSVGTARNAADFAAHWAYQFEDSALARLRATTPWYAAWDDHEIVNDFDPATAGRRLRDGRRLMKAYSGLSGEPLYRRVRYGRHLDLFVLDTRSHRARNDRPDTGPYPKSMLGERQRAWLTAGLADSDATWKIVASSVPLAIPTGTSKPGVRDGWANGDSDTGFERELLEVLHAVARAGVQNIVFLSGDVHFATALRHRVPDTQLRFVELVVGPLSAGVYPTENLDPTLEPQRLFMHGPAADAPIDDFAAALHWFNFGLIEIAADGMLDASVVNARGIAVYTLRLQPQRK